MKNTVIFFNRCVVWAWEGKCCLAVKVFASSVWDALEALASLISLKIVSAVLYNITLDFRTFGQGRSSTRHNTTMRCQVHYARLPHKWVQNSLAKTNEMRPDQPYRKPVDPPFSGQKLARYCFISFSSSFSLSHYASHCPLWMQLTCTPSMHVSTYLAQDLLLFSHYIVSTHSDFTTAVVLFLAHFLSFPACLHLSSMLVHPADRIFNFSFGGSLFSSWLLYSSLCCCLEPSHRVQPDTVTL